MNSNYILKHVRRFSREYYFYPALWLLVLLPGCKDKKIEKEIVIISTNDIHGNIDRFPLLATLVRETKAKYPNVIIADAGDRFIGNPHVDYITEKGKPIITLMNSIGYNLATMGNHEFDYGQKILRERMNEATFPFICANMNSSRSLLDSLPPYLMMEIDGIKLCFLGLIQTDADSLPATASTHLENITFDLYKNKATRYRNLRKQCDAFIGLTHLGIETDSTLAMTMPELDVIIGGHSHTLQQGAKEINDVMITQTGSHLQCAGITRLKFQDKRLVRYTHQTVYLDSIAHPDSLMTIQVQTFNNQPEFKQVIGYLPQEIASLEEVGTLVTKAMVNACPCDLALYNQGGIRVSSLPQGEIRLEKILEIEPFNNYIVVHDMTLEEIKGLIINQFNKTNGNPPVDLFISPGKYTIVQDEAGKATDATIVDGNGRPLLAGQRYRVALNNYMNTNYNFAGKGKGSILEITVIDAVIRWIKNMNIQ